MSIVLVDRGDASRTLSINAWNWHPIVAEIARAKVLSGDAMIRLGPFCGGLDRAEARLVASILERTMLRLSGSERLLLDGSRTVKPDTGEFHRNAKTMHLNHSVSADVLSSFVRFCAECDGFDQ